MEQNHLKKTALSNALSDILYHSNQSFSKKKKKRKEKRCATKAFSNTRN